MATFLLEGCPDQNDFESLCRDLLEAAEAGFHHLTLELKTTCDQTLQQWRTFRPVLETITQRGARLSIKGAPPELEAGLENAAVEAQLRMLDRTYPDFFRKHT